MVRHRKSGKLGAEIHRNPNKFMAPDFPDSSVPHTSFFASKKLFRCCKGRIIG